MINIFLVELFSSPKNLQPSEWKITALHYKKYFFFLGGPVWRHKSGSTVPHCIRTQSESKTTTLQPSLLFQAPSVVSGTSSLLRHVCDNEEQRALRSGKRTELPRVLLQELVNTNSNRFFILINIWWPMPLFLDHIQYR